jgi:hypothetical protein
MKQITKDTILKQGDKTYPAIEVDGGFVWVDKNAEMKDDNWYYNSFNKTVYRLASSNFNRNYSIVIKEDINAFPNQYFKIRATTLGLKGVPKISLEDEVEKLADVYCWGNVYPTKEILIDKKEAFIAGHKSTPAKYTEKDMNGFVTWLDNNWRRGKGGWHHVGDFNKNSKPVKTQHLMELYIKSINTIKVIEVAANFKVINYE